MGFWNREKPPVNLFEEQNHWYGRFVRELLDYCSYLASAANPDPGHRYGSMWTDPESFIRRVGAALSNSNVPLPEALARLLFDLFYADKDVVDFLAMLRRAAQFQEEQLRLRIADLEAGYNIQQERLKAADEAVRQARADQDVLRQLLAIRDREIARLTKSLEEKEAYIRGQNLALKRQQEELNRRRR